MNPKKADSCRKEKSRDSDLVAAEAALKRAALKARQKAKQAGTGVMVWKNGSIVQEN